MKFLYRLIAFISISLFVTSTFAHGPTPQKVDEFIMINADSETVWKQLRQFDTFADWHPAVESLIMEDNATRIVTLTSGGNITDSLDEMNEDGHYISYRLLTENTSAFPVSFYTITIQVSAEESISKVSWIGRFYRGDTGNFPSEELNDDAAVKAMEEYAQLGLSGLKNQVEP
jgi:mxaD protein